MQKKKAIIDSYLEIKYLEETGRKYNCSESCIRNILNVYGIKTIKKRGQQPKDSVNSFWEKVDKKGKDKCWNWTGALDGNGKNYGRIVVDGRVEGAHRFSYEIHVGEISVGMQVLHKCDNRRCVNPSHLFLGTQLDNMQDMTNKGRGRNQYTKITKGGVKNVHHS